MKYTVLGFDIKGFSALTKLEDQKHYRRTLEELVAKALKDVGVKHILTSSSDEVIIDTGDGFFALVDSRDYPTIMNFFLRLVIIANEHPLFKFRGVLHEGEAESTNSLFTKDGQIDKNAIGIGINESARLLDSKPLRDLLISDPKQNFVFGISAETFQKISLRDSIQRQFAEYTVEVKDYRSTIHLYSESELFPKGARIRPATDVTLSGEIKLFLNKSIITEMYQIVGNFLETLYVIPELIREYESKLDTEKISAKKYFDEFIHAPRNIFVSGDDQFGKTSLAKFIYSKLATESELLPVYLDISKNYSGFLSNKIEKAVTRQYNEKITDLKNVKKVIILDDFHTIPSMNQENIFAELSESVNTTAIIMVDSIYNTNLVGTEIINEFDNLSIKELRPSLRNRLIIKWIEANKLQDSNFKLVDNLTDYVDSTIMKGLVPPTPFNVLVILSERMAYSPVNSAVTSKGHCYQTLIILSMRRANINDTEYDIYLNFLQHFAYYLHSNSLHSSGEKKFVQFLSGYGTRFNQPIPQQDFINKLVDSKLLSNNGLGEYEFTVDYIFYYFIAMYLASNKDDKRVRHIIEEVYNNLDKNENGYIGVFIIHHVKDLDILEHLQLNLMTSYEDYAEATLIDDDVEHLEKYIQTIGKIGISEANGSQKRRETNLKHRDELEEESENENKSEPEEEVAETAIRELNALRKAIKTVEVMGHILKTRTGSFPIEIQKDLFRESMKVFMRIANRFIVLFKEDEEQYIEFFKDRISSFGIENLDSDAINKLAVRYYFNLNMLNIWATISRTSSMLCSEQILDIVMGVCDGINTPLSYYIALRCQMWYKKEIPLKEILSFVEGKPLFTQHIAKTLIADYCEFHDTDHTLRQQIATKLNLDLKGLLPEKSR